MKEDFILLLPDSPIHAGFPSPAQDSFPSSSSLNLNSYLIKNENATTLFRVRGDSMKDAGLLDGDIIFVTYGQESKAGDIVIADVDGERTIKFLCFDNQGAYLEPANKSFKSIRPQENLTIVGVVTAMCRKY
jgi:SOS-response transcriptional repressor LexA